MSKAYGYDKARGPSPRSGAKARSGAGSVRPGGTVRTCIGCRKSVPRDELVRMVVGPEGQIVFDLARGSFGRGAWTHGTESCLLRAARVMRGQGVVEEPEALFRALSDAAERRAKGLLSAAYRARRLTWGTDEAAHEYSAGRAKLVILATDSRSAAHKAWLDDAVANGLVWIWAAKAELGALLGRDELAVVVVTDDGLAQSIKQNLALTTPVTSRLAAASLAALRSTVGTTAAGSHGLEDSEDG